MYVLNINCSNSSDRKVLDLFIFISTKSIINTNLSALILWKFDVWIYLFIYLFTYFCSGSLGSDTARFGDSHYYLKF